MGQHRNLTFWFSITRHILSKHKSSQTMEAGWQQTSDYLAIYFVLTNIGSREPTGESTDSICPQTHWHSIPLIAEKSSSLYLTSVENPQVVAECLTKTKVNVVRGIFQEASFKSMGSAVVLPWWKNTPTNSAWQSQFSVHLWHREELLFIFSRFFSVINPVCPILNWNYWKHWTASLFCFRQLVPSHTPSLHWHQIVLNLRAIQTPKPVWQRLAYILAAQSSISLQQTCLGTELLEKRQNGDTERASHMNCIDDQQSNGQTHLVALFHLEEQISHSTWVTSFD